VLARLPLVFLIATGVVIALGVPLDTFMVRSLIVSAIRPGPRRPQLVALAAVATPSPTRPAG
jgi:hypothetical protein